MANRDNHYESAFEEYLRVHGLPYVAVDEGRRILAGDGQSLKNLDFIVSVPGGPSWLIDVKGRRFPSGCRHRQYWKNWSTRDDLDGLARWEAIFGPGFRAMFVFAYQIVGDRAPLPAAQLFAFRDRLYGFVAAPLADYAPAARLISPRWQTVAMSAGSFRQIARPLDDLLAVPTG